ncbi:MAG: lipid-binding SYLF domain-containing protein, partial [Pseudomonadota bacterium]
ADLSIAAGPIGAGAKAQTTDILAFSRSRGLYGGVSLEGAVLKTRRKWNDAYYNASVSPAEVIFKNEVYNPASAQLQNAVWRLAHKDAPASLAPAQPLTYEGDAERDTSGFDDELRDDEDLSDDDIDYEDDDVWGAPIGGSTD